MNIWHSLFLQNLKQLVTETFLKKSMAMELIGQAYAMFGRVKESREENSEERVERNYYSPLYLNVFKIK